VNFSYNFSIFMPNNVVGVVSIRRGQLEATSKNSAFPRLILSGEMEGDQRNECLRVIDLDKKKRWRIMKFCHRTPSYAFQQSGSLRRIGQSFFLGHFKKISAEQSGLLPILENSGWLGNFSGTEDFLYQLSRKQQYGKLVTRRYLCRSLALIPGLVLASLVQSKIGFRDFRLVGVRPNEKPMTGSITKLKS